MKDFNVLEQLAGKHLSKDERVIFVKYIRNLSDDEDICYNDSLKRDFKKRRFRYLIDDDPTLYASQEVSKKIRVGYQVLLAKLKKDDVFNITSSKTKQTHLIRKVCIS